MVSIAEAKSILTQQRQQVESQRQLIVQTLIPKLTIAQVRAQTRPSIIARERQELELETAKSLELKKLEPIEKELTTFEAQIKSVEADISRQARQEADLKIARKLFFKGDTTGIGQTKGVKRFLREFRTEREAFVEKALRDVKAPPFTPVPELVTPLPGVERITFGQPLKFGESFRAATGSTSFTIAVPLRREAGKIRVQDFNFLFENGKLIFANPTGTALITEERFLEVDKSRRLENPGFTFGSTIAPLPVRVTVPKIKRLDPIARFFKEDLPLTLRSIAADFIPNPQKRADISRFIKQVQGKGDQAISKIEKVKVNIEEFFDPDQKEIRQISERNLNTIEDQQKFLNKEVENFNKKFGEKELSENQFKEAQIVSLALSSKQASLDSKTIEFDRRLNELRESGERVPTKFFTETLKSIATSPFTLAQFGIGVSTRPIQTTQQAVQEIKKLPEAISQAPFTVTGQILGTIIGTTVIVNLLKGLTSEAVLVGSKRRFISDRTIPKSAVRKTPLSETFKTEVTFKINENQIRSFAINELNKRGVIFNELSPIEQNFVVGQIKAKIINNPELFIPGVRRILLQKQGVKNIRTAVRERLEGKADTLVRFDSQGRPTGTQELSEIQRLALQRLTQTLERQRIRRVALERVERPIETAFELLSQRQKTFFVEQLKARVRADPRLTLTKAQRIALENIRTQTQLREVRTAILQGLEPRKIGDLLTLSQRRFIKSQIEAQLRANPAKFIPKQRQLALERLQKLQEKKAIERAKEKGAQNLKLSDLISKVDKDFIKGQIDAQIRTQPQRFIPETRQVALQILKRPEPIKPIFKIVSSELTATQKLLLQRLKQIGKVKPRPLVTKVEPKIIGIPTPPPIVKPRTAKALRQELKQVNVQASREIIRLKQLQASKQKSATQLNARLASLQRRRSLVPVFGFKSQQLLQQIQQVRTQLLQTERTITATTLQSQEFSLAVKQISQQKVRELQRIAQQEPFRPVPITRPVVKLIKKKKRKIPKERLPFVTKDKFTVFVRKKKKDIKFKAFSTKKAARRGLKKRLSTTLRASGFITNPRGKKLRPKITKGFRRSKVDPFRIVEKRRRRLDTKSEVIAIQRARKIKVGAVPKMRLR